MSLRGSPDLDQWLALKERHQLRARVPINGGAMYSGVVCVVEDDEAVRASLRLFLELSGFTVRDYASGNAFLAALRPPEIGCLLLGYHLPGLNGIETMKQVRSQGCLVPAIIMTGSLEQRLGEKALRSGAWAFLRKPIDPDILCTTIDKAMHNENKAS